MDPSAIVRELGVAGGLTVAVLLITYCAYKLLPSYQARYEAETAKLTAKDVKHARQIVDKLNGKYVEMNSEFMKLLVAEFKDSVLIKRFLDDWFKASHFAESILRHQTSIEQQLAEHTAEDREVHERVRELEVKANRAESDLRDIREKQDVLRDLIEHYNKEQLAAVHDAKTSMIDAVNRLMERRLNPR